MERKFKISFHASQWGDVKKALQIIEEVDHLSVFWPDGKDENIWKNSETWGTPKQLYFYRRNSQGTGLTFPSWYVYLKIRETSPYDWKISLQTCTDDLEMVTVLRPFIKEMVGETSDVFEYFDALGRKAS